MSDIYHSVEQSGPDLQINLSFSALDMGGNRLRSLPALTNDERISGLILVGAIPEAVIESLLPASPNSQTHQYLWYRADVRLSIVNADNFGSAMRRMKPASAPRPVPQTTVRGAAQDLQHPAAG